MEGHNEGKTSNNGGHRRRVLQGQGGDTGHGYHHQLHPNQGYQTSTIRIKVTKILYIVVILGHIKVEALLLMVVLTHGFSPTGCMTWTTSISGIIYQIIGGSGLLRWNSPVVPSFFGVSRNSSLRGMSLQSLIGLKWSLNLKRNTYLSHMDVTFWTNGTIWGKEIDLSLTM